jgi:protoheme IX farnesyltransferase
MIPVGMITYYIGMSGMASLIIVMLTNLFLVMQCFRLYKEMSAKAARRVMFSSYIHLPIVLLALLMDKVPLSYEEGLGSILKMTHSLFV